MSSAIQTFIKSLKQPPPTDNIFNPWYDRDLENDQKASAPNIRRNHLQWYFEQREHRARYLMIAEAVGYQGGHFSGVAMTSERILLGHLAAKKVHPHHVFENHTPQRTSRKALKAQGFVEPTATIVWGSLLNAQVDPYSFVLWNAVPWHPYQGGHPKGMLSNRTPTRKELDYSRPFLDAFLKLFPNCHILAIGQKCATILGEMEIACHVVRHPANGGATKFREQTLEFLKQHP